jgi:opacity protein-like surface antigen
MQPFTGGSSTVETKIPIAAGLVVAWLSVATFGMPSPVSAEWYVAGDVGANFADRLTGISGTGDLTGRQAPDFDLKNSVSYGAKLGYFRDHSWFGIEGEVLQTTPHIKNLDDVPGIHLRVTTIGVNFLARYPGRTFQPYVGFGVGPVIAHLSDSATTQSNTDVAGGWNMLVGLRAFVTPYVAVFTEYKYTGATLRFDQAFGTGGFEGVYRAQHMLVGLSYHF